MKSSVQRHIRTGFCEQIPFLNLPAYSDASKSEPQVQAAPEVKDEEPEEEVTKSKGGKKKGGGKKGGKNKGGKEDVEDAPVEGGDEQQLAVIDEIWPKKDALGISKWSVKRVALGGRRLINGDPLAARTASVSIPLTAYLFSGSISTDRLCRL